MAVAHDAFTQGPLRSGPQSPWAFSILVAGLLRNVRAAGHEDVTPIAEDAEAGGRLLLQPACAET